MLSTIFGRCSFMIKKRGFLTQLVRHLVQLAAFILFPGLFISVFSAVRDLVTAVVEGRFSFGGLFPQILLVFVVFLVTALWGRFFCGFLCSFGMMQELLFFFSKRALFKKARMPGQFDAVMKYLKYGILVLITAGVWILALPVDSSWSPWGVFGMLVSGNLSVVSRAIPTVGFVLLLAIAAGSLFAERFFCRYLCPLGALFALTSGKRLYKIRRRSDTCTGCGLCTRTCSMGIHIPEKDAVVSGECIQCMRCLSICPKESLSADPAGAIAGTAAAAAIGGSVVVGDLVSFPVSETVSGQQVTEKTERAEITEITEKGNYKDGIYTGTGEGFRGTIQVQVTVEDGYIADITVLSFQDDREFFQKAQSAVINDILAEQTSDVDAVSGATFSSSGIIEAVADALESGMGESEQPANHSNEDAAGQPAGGVMEPDGNLQQPGSDEAWPSGGNGSESRTSDDSKSEPADSGKDDAAGGENGSESGKPGADGESGAGSGQPGAGTGNGHGSGQPGAGQGNGSGAGHQGNGGHGRGWHGGSGSGGHRGRRN